MDIIRITFATTSIALIRNRELILDEITLVKIIRNFHIPQPKGINERKLVVVFLLLPPFSASQFAKI